MVTLSLVILMGFNHCSRSRNQNPLVGKYDLQGHDYSGKLIFHGAISFTSVENDEVKGICKVVKVEQAFRGAVEKDGPCEARVSGDKITIYLSPSLSDAGVVFDGNWNAGNIAGTWRIESLLGGKTYGTFDAKRQ